MNNIDVCYDHPERGRAFCVYLDIGTQHLDRTFAEIMHVSPYEFFGNEQLEQRAFKALSPSGLTLNQVKEFIHQMTPRVVDGVDYAMLKALNEERE